MDGCLNDGDGISLLHVLHLFHVLYIMHVLPRLHLSHVLPDFQAMDAYQCRIQKWFAYWRRRPDFGPPEAARQRAHAMYFEADHPSEQLHPLEKDVGSYLFKGARSSIFFPLASATATKCSFQWLLMRASLTVICFCVRPGIRPLHRDHTSVYCRL